MVRGPGACALGPAHRAGKRRAQAGSALRKFERLHAGPAFTEHGQRRDRQWSESAAEGGQLVCPQHERRDGTSVGEFACGVWWDMTDVYRETSRFDVAFWLHLLGGMSLRYQLTKTMLIFGWR